MFHFGVQPFRLPNLGGVFILLESFARVLPHTIALGCLGLLGVLGMLGCVATAHTYACRSDCSMGLLGMLGMLGCVATAHTYACRCGA